MTKKLIIATLIAIAISFCAFQSISVQAASSDKVIELKPGMTLTDPGKNAVFSIISIDSANNVFDLGIRIDGSNEMIGTSPLPEFQEFYQAAKLGPTTATPSLKKSSSKPSPRPIKINVGDTWKCLKADAGITIESQNGDILQLGIRIDGSQQLLLFNTTIKALNITLSNPPNGFQLVGQKAKPQNSSS
jgi:hypothetical protein